MDFLEIRRKAKERAAAEAARGAVAPVAEPRPPASAPPAPPPGDAAQGMRGADAVNAGEGADVRGDLAAELQRLPPAGAEEPEGELDARFTTWRPGTGQRPFIPPPEPAPEPPPLPSEIPAVAPAPQVAAPALAPVLPVEAPPVAPASRAEHSHRWSAARSPDPAPIDPLEEFFYRADEELPAAGALALPAAAGAEAREQEDARVDEYLTFQLGAEEYAVAIERVREVLKSQQVTEVPRAPAGILGVVTVRGEVVAVFDPRRRLGLPGPTPEPGLGRIIIVDDGEGPCGLLVDVVASVVRLARGSIEPTPQGIGGASADCLAGIGRERSRLFTVLDLAALLRRGPGAPRGARGTHAGS